MSNQEKLNADLSNLLRKENLEFSDLLKLDYCDFRLNSLAKKIKSEYLKLRKQEQRFINP